MAVNLMVIKELILELVLSRTKTNNSATTVMIPGQSQTGFAQPLRQSFTDFRYPGNDHRNRDNLTSNDSNHNHPNPKGYPCSDNGGVISFREIPVRDRRNHHQSYSAD